MGTDVSDEMVAAVVRAIGEMELRHGITALDAWIADTFAAQEARAAAPGFAARLEDGTHGGPVAGASVSAALDGLLVAMIHEATGHGAGERGAAGRPKEQWHDESRAGPGA